LLSISSPSVPSLPLNDEELVDRHKINSKYVDGLSSSRIHLRL
jgi:hypothetical protein